MEQPETFFGFSYRNQGVQRRRDCKSYYHTTWYCPDSLMFHPCEAENSAMRFGPYIALFGFEKSDIGTV